MAFYSQISFCNITIQTRHVEYGMYFTGESIVSSHVNGFRIAPSYGRGSYILDFVCDDGGESGFFIFSRVQITSEDMNISCLTSF